jgi:hypothetical protein
MGTGSRWNHSICEACWQKRNGTREPVRVKGPEVVRCCYCGLTHCSGIYLREDPQTVACRGQGPEHND